MFHSFTKALIFGFFIVCVAATSDLNQKSNVKRSYGFELSPFDVSGDYGSGPWFSKPFPPSPAEITSAIAAAKQASANVIIAQQQVQSEKENLLNQQKIANEKETYANIAKQKNDVFAAVQRSEAGAAAQAVVLAQQRLAAAKQAVAQQQRLAAQKETNAAIAIQNAAHAAASEIQRTENIAKKLSNIQRNDNAALIHHVSATKDAIVGPITNGGNVLHNDPRFLLASSFPWNSMPAVNPWGSQGIFVGHNKPFGWN